MDEENWPACIVLTLDTERPIEINDFVSAFTSLSNQYQKFVRASYPNVSPDFDIYVAEIRPGSIVADLIAWASSTLAPVGHDLQRQIIQQFMRSMGARLTPYFRSGGRLSEATKSDLGDFIGVVQAIATDPHATSKIEAAIYEDKHKNLKNRQIRHVAGPRGDEGNRRSSDRAGAQDRKLPGAGPDGVRAIEHQGYRVG